MSDFDKEAERERLREKFERDEKKREATQRMSELLLQGATMTNRHCDECGDPIFRYDGEEFCPTCQSRVAGEGERRAESGASGATDANATGSGPSDATSAEADQTDSTPTGAGGDPGGEAARSDAVDVTPANADAREPRGNAADTADGATRARTPTTGTPARDADGVSAARESLVRTLVRFSEAAAETDDPRRARERLAAAREAAEALAALER